MDRLTQDGYDNMEIVKYSAFFEERVLVLQVTREGEAGVVVIDSHGELWLSHSILPSSNPDIAYNIYKGRALLSTFNEIDGQ